MTTPPMQELNPLQAAKINDLSRLTQALLQGVPSWRCPTADVVTLPRRTTPVGQSVSTVWADVGLKTFGFGNGSALVGESLPGLPVEAVSKNAPTVNVWVISPWLRDTRVMQIPVPAQPWIEGHPHRTGEYDRHWMGVAPDGTAWEVLNLRWAWGAWWCDEAAKWSPKGDLVAGHPICAASVQLSPLILTKASLDAPHVVGLALPDYAGGADGTLNVQFPRCGDHVRIPTPPPASFTGDARKAWSLGHTHGFLIHDKTGVKGHGGVPVQPGAQWSGSNIHTLTIPTGSLELVTS